MNIASAARAFEKNAAVIGALAALIVLFIFAHPAADGCREGIELCMNVAVPSLFPMMFATVLASETGLTQRIGRMLAPAARWMFGLSQEAAGAVVMALVGGYPAGARTVATLCERGAISRDEAQRMMLFCFAAGPAFLIGAVGGMYGSAVIGAVLLVIQIVSVVLTGVLVRFLPHKDAVKAESASAGGTVTPKSFAGCVVTALSDTVRVMLGICQYIVLFSIIQTILSESGVADAVADFLVRCRVPESTAKAVLPVALEVTSGCMHGSRAGLPVTAFAVGFGGLAVHTQVLTTARSVGVKYQTFFAFRVMQGIICALLSWLYTIIMPGQSIAASAAVGESAALSTTPAGAVLLVVMSAMWIICLPMQGRENFRTNAKRPTVP